MAIAFKEGGLAFRAKWTAKELYIHARTFGPIAGARYVVERVERVRERRGVDLDPVTGPMPAALRTTVVYGLAPVLVPEGEPSVVIEQGHVSELNTVIPVARRLVFADAVPGQLRSCLAQIRANGVHVTYVYGRRRGRGHGRLVAEADAAIYLPNTSRGFDLLSLSEALP